MSPVGEDCSIRNHKRGLPASSSFFEQLCSSRSSEPLSSPVTYRTENVIPSYTSFLHKTYSKFPSFLARSLLGSCQSTSNPVCPPPGSPPPPSPSDKMSHHGSKTDSDAQTDENTDDEEGFTTPRRISKAHSTPRNLDNTPIGLSNSFSVLEVDDPMSNAPIELIFKVLQFS